VEEAWIVHALETLDAAQHHELLLVTVRNLAYVSAYIMLVSVCACVRVCCTPQAGPVVQAL
jgi:hypothetical protein